MDCIGISEKKMWNRVVDAPVPHIAFVHLPYYGIPMWSDTCYDYCRCAQCAAYLEEPSRIGLGFTAKKWIVVMFCGSCATIENTSYCGIPIYQIEDVLRPIINAACVKKDNTCSVCERNNCTDPDCEDAFKMLNRSDVEDLLEHFYRQRIDVVSALRFPVCHRLECNETTATKWFACDVCRRVCYCGKRCKRESENHACIPYQEIWR